MRITTARTGAMAGARRACKPADDPRAAEDWANAATGFGTGGGGDGPAAHRSKPIGERAATEYGRVRLLALENTVEPILKERVSALEAQANAMPGDH